MPGGLPRRGYGPIGFGLPLPAGLPRLGASDGPDEPTSGRVADSDSGGIVVEGDEGIVSQESAGSKAISRSA